jgi:hypothetical protein
MYREPTYTQDRNKGIYHYLNPLLTSTVFLSLLFLTSSSYGASIGKDTSPDGFWANCYLPLEERMKNVGGSDGSGLCVFTSLEHAAREQGIESLRGFRKWM